MKLYGQKAHETLNKIMNKKSTIGLPSIKFIVIQCGLVKKLVVRIGWVNKVFRRRSTATRVYSGMSSTLNRPLCRKLHKKYMIHTLILLFTTTRTRTYRTRSSKEFHPLTCSINNPPRSFPSN